MKWRSIGIVVMVCLAVMASCVAALPPGYLVTDLSTLGGDATSAQAINDLGQVVGYSQTGVREWATDKYGGYWVYQEQAFLNNNGRMINLGTLGGWYSYAYDINERGQVTGFAATSYSTYHAFLWDSAGMEDIGTISTSPTAVSDAYGVNDSGHVTGSSSIDPYGERAYIYKDGAMANIGALPADVLWSQASDINNHDQIVGRSFFAIDSLTPYRAFLWENGLMTQLGTLGGYQSWALALNNAGQVVGWADVGSPLNQLSHAFLWHSVGGMTDLGTLGGTSSTAYGINNLGWVVGKAGTADRRGHAFIWENGLMTDLNDLIDPASGWEMKVANGINNIGQIVGNGVYQGQERGFLLTPVPEPSALLALSGGIAGLIACRKKIRDPKRKRGGKGR